MFLSYITLAVALSLSIIAAWYSIAGLAAIFAAAVMPIVIMGGILELAKVVVTLWLHEYWPKCRFLMKAYLVPAVIVLMFITSMGIFGFLSKAHSDQSLVSGDVQSKIAIYDEKIKISKENIDANRRALKQMDEAVDQVMGRSADEKGADKAVALRRAQAKERTRLLSEITAEQKTIAQLSEERAPIAAEVRKVEAEVGPIKYIAALVYGDNPDANLLERAVRWVIILLVAVFDPLAIMMLLAATESLKWDRQNSRSTETPKYAADDGALTDDQLQQIQESAPEPREKSLEERYPYLFRPFDHFKNLKPLVAKSESTAENTTVTEVPSDDDGDDVIDANESPAIRAAVKEWKRLNPTDTIKHQRNLFARGQIHELPWMQLVASTDSNFGITFPVTPKKGDTFVRTDRIPHRLYKFNGNEWIEIDKNVSDSYTYNEAYVDYLIDQINQGQYDPDLLSDNERDQITLKLSNKQ